MNAIVDLRYLHGPSVDIEKLISEELEREEPISIPPTRSGSVESLYSTTSSSHSSRIGSPINFDPFFTPRDAKSNFEIGPFFM